MSQPTCEWPHSPCPDPGEILTGIKGYAQYAAVLCPRHCDENDDSQ
jgi:cytosine/adenosine deaminase-related metal-dependent hydrolase